MEEKNSAVELNNKLRQELVSGFLLITQTVNILESVFFTLIVGSTFRYLIDKFVVYMSCISLQIFNTRLCTASFSVHMFYMDCI
jgi:hypothetical protein